MAEIVVLDDVRDAGVLVQRILERQGHRVTVFTDDRQAVEHVRRHPVDCVILDIKLQGCSGIDVLEELKRIKPALKVMILTGYPTLETAREALVRGAVEYCVKPIDKHELEDRVREVLQAEGAADGSAGPAAAATGPAPSAGAS